MCWNAHDGAGAVVHHNVIRHPDWNLFAVIWIDRVATCVHAVFFDFTDISRLFSFPLLGDQLIHFVFQAEIFRREVAH